MQEIKFCLYCGSNDLEIGEICCPAVMSSKEKYVSCKQCGAQGPIAINDELAILKWNNRIQEEPEIPEERPRIAKSEVYLGDDNFCPFLVKYNTQKCRRAGCMMWVSVGDDKGRCGLVNTVYINSTGCGV